ncbi:hypothetical protein ACWEKM_14600 [Streptomyces sp. NPDC004752]
MANVRVLRSCVALAAVGGMLLVGCTDGTGGPIGKPESRNTPGRSATGTPKDEAGQSATPSVPDGDRAGQPRTASQARRLVGDVIADPYLFGAEVVRATPYQSDPDRWTVLQEDCTWHRRTLPKDVLATLTRYFEIPASGGKGTVHLSATATVHRTTKDAAWEQARMLEEAVGCPEQTLRPGERLTGLLSSAFARGEGGNTSSDDALSETGKCVSDTRGGPYPYWWRQSTLGPVVVSVSVCAGPGRSVSELQDLDVEGLTGMLLRVEEQIGGGGADTDAPDPDAPDPDGSAAKKSGAPATNGVG